MGIQAIIDPIVASIAGGVGDVGAAIGGAFGGGAADAGAVAAGTASAAGGADAATTAALGTIAAQNAAEGGILAAAAPELDAAATGAGLSAADIGGSFASLAATPAADFLGATSGALGAGVPGSTATAAPVASPGAAVAAPAGAATGAAPGAGAAGGSAAAGAAPIGATVSPSSIGAFGWVDPSLITDASAPAGLTGDAATTGASAAPAGLTGATGSEVASGTGTLASAITGAGDGSGGPGADAGFLGNLKTYGPLALSGGGLLSSVLAGEKKPKFEGDASAQAAQLQAQGAQLESYLTSGTLPPGISAGLTAAHDAAAATIRSQYAARGQTGSSAEMQDLSNLAATTVSQGAQIATNLLQQGVSESEFSAQLYQSLMQSSMEQDAALSKSISNFAGGLAGMGLKATPTE
jgi:hypothetical protein